MEISIAPLRELVVFIFIRFKNGAPLAPKKDPQTFFRPPFRLKFLKISNCRIF